MAARIAAMETKPKIKEMTLRTKRIIMHTKKMRRRVFLVSRAVSLLAPQKPQARTAQ